MKNKALTKRMTATRRSGFTDRLEESRPKGVLKCSALGTSVAVLSALSLTLLLAFILYSTKDPAKYAVPTAFTILYTSALIGGFTAAALNKRSALLCGLAVGVALLTVTFVLSFALPTEVESGNSLFLAAGLRCALVFCAVAGAFIGSHNKKEIKKSSKRKKR